MGDDPFFIDLPKDRRLVLDDLIPPTRHTNRLARNLVNKRQLGSWSNADRDARIFRRRKSSRARTEVSRRQLVANFRRAGFDAVKAVVTHLGTPHGKPLSQLNPILFLLLAHQWTLLRAARDLADLYSL